MKNQNMWRLAVKGDGAADYVGLNYINKFQYELIPPGLLVYTGVIDDCRNTRD